MIYDTNKNENIWKEIVLIKKTLKRKLKIMGRRK